MVLSSQNWILASTGSLGGGTEGGNRHRAGGGLLIRSYETGVPEKNSAIKKKKESSAWSLPALRL